MKKRLEFIDIKNDLEELLRWIEGGSDKDTNLFQEIILNVLRIITDKSFRKEVQLLRDIYHVPTTWYKEQKYKPLHLAMWRNIKLSDDQLQLGNSYEAEEDKWFHDYPEASKNVQSWDDKAIIELAIKYKLHPRRYGDFLIEYLFFGSVVPPIFSSFEEFTEDESKYKVRLELEPENPSGSGIVGYIRFFQDTSINQLHEFIESHSPQIKSIQEYLDKYPIQEKNRPDTFKFHLQMYLMFCIGYTDAEINDKFPTMDCPNIRKNISIMRSRIRLSADTPYQKSIATVKKS